MLSKNEINWLFILTKKPIKTPNDPAFHWSTLWPLEVWFHGLYNSYNSGWFCIHNWYNLCLFIYLWSSQQCNHRLIKKTDRTLDVVSSIFGWTSFIMTLRQKPRGVSRSRRRITSQRETVLRRLCETLLRNFHYCAFSSYNFYMLIVLYCNIDVKTFFVYNYSIPICFI